MALHHQIQPHHHVATWAVVALGVILAASSYTNATLAQGQADYQDDGPSEQTKNFFGGNTEKKTTGSLPTECQPTGPVNPTDQPPTQVDQLPTPANYQIQGRPTISQEEYDKMTEEQRAQMPADLVIVDSASQTAPPADSGNYQAMSEEEKAKLQTQQSTSNSFETPECRKAMMAQIRNEMGDFQDKMRGGEFTAKLDNMLAVIAKLQNSGLQALKDSGVDTAKLESQLQPIIDDTNSLKAFFAKMLAAMDKFFELSEQPETAFTYMREGFPHGEMKNAATVADRLVTNIIALQKELEVISQSVQTTVQPSPSPTAAATPDSVATPASATETEAAR